MVAQVMLNIVKRVPRIAKGIVKPCAKHAGAILKNTSKVVKTSTHEIRNFISRSDGIKTQIRKTLGEYNAAKLLNSEKHGSSRRILNNWRHIFGIKNQNGVFQNAIDHLNQIGAIDKYIFKRCPQLQNNPKDFQKIKSLLTKYLEKNLDIYTYERIEKILMNFNKTIAPKLEKGAVIYVPDPKKSYGIVTDMYKAINPDAKIISGWNNLKNFAKTQKELNLVILDDCLVSGKSAVKNYDSILEGCKNVKNIDMYVMAAYEEGAKIVPKGITLHYDGKLKTFMRNSEYFKNEVNNKDKGLLLQFLGSGEFEYNAGCAIMFPYMSPNNNCTFAVHMIKELFSGPECAIKGFTSTIQANEKVMANILKVIEGKGKGI